MTHCRPFVLRTKTPNQIYLHFAIIKNHSRHACLSCDEAQLTHSTFLSQIILTTWLHLTHADFSQTDCLRDLPTFNQTSRRHTQEPQNYEKMVDRSVSYNTERIFHLQRLVQTIGFTKCRIGNGYQKVSLEDKKEVAAAFEVMWYTTVPEQTWPKVLSWTVWLVVLLSGMVGDCCHFHKQLTRTRSRLKTSTWAPHTCEVATWQRHSNKAMPRLIKLYPDYIEQFITKWTYWMDCRYKILDSVASWVYIRLLFPGNICHMPIGFS